VATDSSAKDFLLAAQKLDSESAIKISDIISYNQNYIYSVDSSFETFFKGTLGPTKVSLVPFLHLETSGDNGFMVSSDSTGGQDSQSQQPGGQSASGNSAEDIVNNGDTFVLKNATYQILLDGDEMEKINFLNGSFNMGSIEVENVEDETFKNANLSFDIEDKKLDFKVTFENNVPTIYVQLHLNLKLREVEDDGVVAENIGENSLSNVVVEAVEKKVRKNMAEAVKIMRENQIDIPNFYTMMHNSNIKAFERFLEGLEDKEDYLNYVVFKSSVKVLMK
jgi:hypothetical protein